MNEHLRYLEDIWTDFCIYPITVSEEKECIAANAKEE